MQKSHRVTKEREELRYNCANADLGTYDVSRTLPGALLEDGGLQMVQLRARGVRMLPLRRLSNPGRVKVDQHHEFGQLQRKNK